MTTSRRSGWAVLLTVAAALLGVACAVRARKRKRPGRSAPPDPAVPGAVAPAKPVPVGSSSSDPTRSLVRMAVGAAIVVVLALATVIVTRPSDTGRTANSHPEFTLSSTRSAVAVANLGDTTAMPGPMSLADCQAAIAANPSSIPRSTCGYETAGWGLSVDEPSADPRDPRYAGASLPIGLSTSGHACVTGPDRPVLDTASPALSTSFTAAPGLQWVASTFQLRGVDGPTTHDLDLPGDTGPQLTATLDFRREGPLKHGLSYRWRVRGTPPSIAAGGWSPWCEFTIASTTPDDLGLDNGRDYTIALPAATWREVLKVLGPVETDVNGNKSTHAPIEYAVKSAKPSASRVPVTLSGRHWNLVVNDLAYWASTNDVPADWSLADLVSTALGGPQHPTMGFPRT